MYALGKRRVIAVLLGLLSLTACATLAHLTDLQNGLAQAGYRNISINHNTTNGYDTLSIALVSDTAAQPISEADVLPVARIVWETYQEHFDELRIQLNGEPTRVSRAELERLLGARKPGLEAGGGANTGLLILLGLVIGVGIVVAVILRGRRSRRRRPPPDPPYPTTYPQAPPA